MPKLIVSDESQSQLDRSLGIDDPTAKQFLALIDKWIAGEVKSAFPPLPPAGATAEQVMAGLCFRLRLMQELPKLEEGLHSTMSKPLSPMRDRELRIRRFKTAYENAKGSHTHRVEVAGKAVGIKRREAFEYARDAGLRSEKK
jgi:hypothetical protein